MTSVVSRSLYRSILRSARRWAKSSPLGYASTHCIRVSGNHPGEVQHQSWSPAPPQSVKARATTRALPAHQGSPASSSNRSPADRSIRDKLLALRYPLEPDRVGQGGVGRRTSQNEIVAEMMPGLVKWIKHYAQSSDTEPVRLGSFYTLSGLPPELLQSTEAEKTEAGGSEQVKDSIYTNGGGLESLKRCGSGPAPRLDLVDCADVTSLHELETFIRACFDLRRVPPSSYNIIPPDDVDSRGSSSESPRDGDMAGMFVDAIATGALGGKSTAKPTQPIAALPGGSLEDTVQQWVDAGFTALRLIQQQEKLARNTSVAVTRSLRIEATSMAIPDPRVSSPAPSLVVGQQGLGSEVREQQQQQQQQRHLFVYRIRVENLQPPPTQQQEQEQQPQQDTATSTVMDTDSANVELASDGNPVAISRKKKKKKEDSATLLAAEQHATSSTADSTKVTDEAKERGDHTLRVFARQWEICLEDGTVVGRVPQGSPGLVGHYPTLRPGDVFEYHSFTELPSGRGFMKGAFSVQPMGMPTVVSPATAPKALEGESFEAVVAPFPLCGQ